MLVKYEKTIATDGSGDATVYAASRARGIVKAVKYAPGTLDAGAALTVTGETTGVPILAVAAAGGSDVWFYPRRLVSKSADGAAATDAFAPIWVYLERIKIVVATGGDTLTGTITFYVDEEQ